MFTHLNKLSKEAVRVGKLCSQVSHSSSLVGRSAEMKRIFTTQEVEQFAKLTGDFNPIHLNIKDAKESGFDKCVVHGALTNGLLSALMGTKLPGPGTVIASQQIVFVQPLYVDEEVTAKVEITSVRKSLVMCNFSCIATNGNKIIINGSAKLLIKS